MYDGMIQSIVDHLADHCDPEEILLFGSLAKGLAKKESDIDLLVIMDVPLPKSNRGTEWKGWLREYPIPIDIQFVTREEFEEGKKHKHAFLASVSQTGQTVYKRTSFNRSTMFNIFKKNET